MDKIIGAICILISILRLFIVIPAAIFICFALGPDSGGMLISDWIDDLLNDIHCYKGIL